MRYHQHAVFRHLNMRSPRIVRRRGASWMDATVFPARVSHPVRSHGDQSPFERVQHDEQADHFKLQSPILIDESLPARPHLGAALHSSIGIENRR